jgi:hypothetical protein
MIDSSAPRIMFILDGKPLSPDRAFTHNNVQYPATWLRNVSPEDRAAIGIEEVPDQVQTWDQRFYWGVSEDGSLIEKDLQQLKEQWTAQVKTTAKTLMDPTDWMITRSAEPGGKPVSEAVLAERTLIRIKSDEKEDAIEQSETVAELAEYVTGFDFGRWQDADEEEAVSSSDDFVSGAGVISSGALYGSEGEDTIVL